VKQGWRWALELPTARLTYQEVVVRAVYDQIGLGYGRHRRADPRLAGSLADSLALKPPAVLADIGAGTGNYSRAMADLGFLVKAVEPSPVMRAQGESHPSVHWLDGVAEALPLDDRCVDGVFCMLASQHFSCLETAITEMARVCPSGPIVWFTIDPRLEESPWLRDYFPEVHERGLGILRPLEYVCGLLETHSRKRVTVIPWSVPHDLQDCFWASGWRRPEMYLDPELRASISVFALAGPAAVEEGLSRLRQDIATGEWKRRYGSLLERQSIDWGYRFLRAD